MPTVVVGTAGHIDHGKTALLRSLTGIDADRLPEERARGMTIDVGFAHLVLDDGSAIDFVDVPGHDRLIGNMLVGAGEIDAVLLAVASDDGPRAQTLEHLELLDALELRHAIVAITKTDLVDAGRAGEVAAVMRAIVDATSMAGARIVPVSALTGDGLATLRQRLIELRDATGRDLATAAAAPAHLPIDRAFTVRGHGTVVTGTLRGGPVQPGSELRVQPSARRRVVRVREVQVHHGRAEVAFGGRTALNLAGADAGELRRGQVLADVVGSPARTGPPHRVVATDRLLAALRRPVSLTSGGRGSAVRDWPPRPGSALRLHLWTESVDATVRPSAGRWASLPDRPAGRDGHGAAEVLPALVRLGHPIAAVPGARAALRDPGAGRVVAGLTVLDPRPPRGASRRRSTPARVAALARAVLAAGSGDGTGDAVDAALVDFHGFLDGHLATDVEAALEARAIALAGESLAIADLRARLGRELRRLATMERGAAGSVAAAVDRLIEGLVASGRLARDGDRIVEPSRRAAIDDALDAAMARLQSRLDADVPPPLGEAAGAAGCPPEGLRRLEASGRIVRVDDDLAWSADRYAALRARALELARQRPLTPAAFRDAIGGNRRVALALLEDLGRRNVLVRTDAGHVPGPRA